MKVKWVLFCTGFLLVRGFCLIQTDGFALSKIHSDLSLHMEWETEGDIGFVCDQPFYYLGHGAQMFAFVSKDQTTVLKFYRHHRTGHPFGFLKPIFPRLAQTLDKRQNKRLKDFTSYKIAYDYFAEDTGLLYLHLNKTHHLKKRVELYDKIGVRHYVDLDNVEFILQKKADLIYPTLEKWIAQGEFRKAQTGLSKLVGLLRKRHQIGIFDKDPDLKTNFGFVGDEPIQFDFGRFKKEPNRLDSDELIRITDRLCIWLDEKAPALAKYLRMEVQ